MIARMMANPITTPPSSPPRGSPVGERVRRTRLAAGISQFQLAARAGLSLQTVGLIERAGVITRASAEKVAPVLGLTVEELLR